MANVNIVRTTTPSQLNSLLTQASASTTYLTQVSASTNYLTKSSASTTYLTQASASTAYLTQASASTAYAPITPLTQTGFRNKIINGGFDIWQRGTSAFTTAGYTADRWAIQNASGQTISVTKQAFTPGNTISGQEPTNFLRISLSGTPSGTYWLTQKVEDVRTFAGQTVTLSFWAKAGSATTALLPALEQNFGSGGSSVVTTTGSAISLTTSWQRFSQTFSVPSISGKTIGTNSFLEVRPFLGSTAITGNNIDIWGVQLELGSTATPFEQRLIGLELLLCQRYYQNIVTPNSTTDFNGLMVRESATQAQASVYLPVSMRATPALVGSYLGRCVFRDTSFNVLGASNSAIAVSSSGPSTNWITLVITHASVAGSYVYAEWDLLNTTTNLGLNSEL